MKASEHFLKLVAMRVSAFSTEDELRDYHLQENTPVDRNEGIRTAKNSEEMLEALLDANNRGRADLITAVIGSGWMWINSPEGSLFWNECHCYFNRSPGAISGKTAKLIQTFTESDLIEALLKG